MIALVRHGHTPYNIKGELGRFCGSSDPAISERGIEESHKVALRLRSMGFDNILSSPRLRAVQTAEIIARCTNLPMVLDNAFREIDYGVWEGLTKTQIASEFKDDFLTFTEHPFDFAPKDGEKPKMALQRIIERFQLVPDNSVIVSHKTVLRLLICDIMQIPPDNYREIADLRLASISLVSLSARPEMIELNSIEHLA